MNNKKAYLPFIAGVLTATIFGLSLIFTSEGLLLFTPFELLSYRFSLAAIVLTLLVAAKVIKVSYKGKPMKMLALLAFFQPVSYFICETYALKYASITQTGIFIAFSPIVSTLLAYFILKEKPFGKQALFVTISAFGAFLNVISSGRFESGGGLLAITLLIGLVAAGGGYNIAARKSTKTFSPVEVTFFMMWTGAIVFNVMNLIEKAYTGTSNSFMEIFTVTGAVTIVYLGLFCCIFAFFLLNYTLSKISVASVSVFIQLASVIQILSGVTLGGESLHLYQILSGTLIVAGVFGANYYENKKRKLETVTNQDWNARG